MAFAVGTVDIPERVDRAQYFRELSYLELSVLFDKESTRDKWAAIAPKGVIGLVCPTPLTVDERLGLTTKALGAGCVVFKSPHLFAPSQANRDRLRAFFTETASADAIGVDRVWIPDGLWETRSAVKLATELGVACAFDPMVRAPGEPPEIYDDLEADSLYFRVEALGRSGTMSDEQLEDLAALVESYEDRVVRVAFASRERWRDARNFKKLLNAD